jgi:hypothetical protein
MMNFGEERGDGEEWGEQEGNTSKVSLSLSLSLSVLSMLFAGSIKSGCCRGVSSLSKS